MIIKISTKVWNSECKMIYLSLADSYQQLLVRSSPQPITLSFSSQHQVIIYSLSKEIAIVVQVCNQTVI